MPNNLVILKEKTDLFNNMQLDETLEWVEKIICHMACEVSLLKNQEREHAEVVEKLLNEETFKRYKGLALSLKLPYQNFKNHSDPATRDMIERGLLVQSWATLGSLLESTLQMFLAFYYRFYIESEFFKWEKGAIAQIEQELKGFKENLEEIVKQNNASGELGLTTKIKNSFFKKVKDILKQKKDSPDIDRITLSILIDFYFNENIFNLEESGDDLKKINNYRNSIHSFQERVIGSWDEYNLYLKSVIVLLLDILYRLPNLPDGMSTPEWYFEEKTEIGMKEFSWFKHQIIV